LCRAHVYRGEEGAHVRIVPVEESVCCGVHHLDLVVWHTNVPLVGMRSVGNGGLIWY
jgi:hypothetical protein